MRNLKQITKQRLNRLIIALALLLVPTAVNSKTCEDKLKYPTAALHNLVQSCFQHLNMNSIQMFGAPIIPIFGINQCVCIADKIRRDHECLEDYMVKVLDGTSPEILGEYSKECIVEGAMGEEARKAYLGGIDNKTIVDLFGATLTLTAAYMKKSNLFIGNDSGLMHLATASNLPTIALFGPTNDIVYGPWGEKNIVIRTKENYNYFKKIKINRNLSYMNSIKPEDVYTKIKSLGYCEKQNRNNTT